MLAADGVLGLVLLGGWIFAVIDAITTPPDTCRNLPKIAWVLIVILLMVPGAIMWFVAGRPWGVARAARGPREVSVGAPRRVLAPDDDEEFLAGLRARAEEQRRRAREQRDDDDGRSAG